MAYDVPTAAALKAKYPAFGDVADATVDIHLADAAASAVDTSWREADYGPATMAYAAHAMALLAIGSHGQVAGYARGGVTSVRSGSFGVSIDAETARAAAGGTLDATPYGREYKRLLGKNKSGPRVIATRLEPAPWGPVYRTNDGVRWP